MEEGESKFISEPTGEGKWYSEVSYSVTSCIVTQINLEMSCQNCPIKTQALGVLSKDPSDTFKIFDHHTVVWRNPPVVDQRNCKSETIFKGVGKLSNFDTKTLRIIDSAAQLEYIFANKLTSTCFSRNFYPVKGIPDTFIKYKVKTHQQSSIDVSAILKHTSTGYCLAITTTANSPPVLGFHDCSDPRFKFLIDKVGNLRFDNKRIDDKLNLAPCTQTSSSGWTLSIDTNFLKLKEKCLTIDTYLTCKIIKLATPKRQL